MSATYYPPSSSQSYGSYQAPYPNHPTQNQYSAQFAAQSGQSPYPGYQPSSPAPEPISAPDIPAVTSEIGSQIIQRLISSELHQAGFDAAQPTAVLRLEQEVVTCPSYCRFLIRLLF